MSRRRKNGRRLPEEFSVSFLDVICCGFGAVILLLMITKTAQSQILDFLIVDWQNQLIKLKQSFFELESENENLDQKINHLTLIERDLSAQETFLKKRIKQEDIAVPSEDEKRRTKNYKKLRQRLEELSLLEKELLKNMTDVQNELVLGIHADRPYIVFVVDLSGSMETLKRAGHLSKVISSILDAHPQTKGMQFFDAGGNQIVFTKVGWIADTLTNRTEAKRMIEGYNGLESNPTAGLIKAVDLIERTQVSGSIFLIGDDFRSAPGRCDDPTRLVYGISKRNHKGLKGVNIAKINAIGMRSGPQGDWRCFAKLARPLTGNNDGAFVGL